MERLSSHKSFVLGSGFGIYNFPLEIIYLKPYFYRNMIRYFNILEKFRRNVLFIYVIRKYYIDVAVPLVAPSSSGSVIAMDGISSIDSKELFELDYALVLDIRV